MSGAPPGAFGPPNPALIPSPPSASALSYAHAFVAVVIPLNVIAFIVFSGRLFARSFPVFRMGADDYVIIAAYCFTLADSIVLLLTIPYAINTDPALFTIADLMVSNMYAVIAQPLWAWSMALIKTSIALMLLRLETNKQIRRFLWFIIGVQAVLAVYNTISQCLQCIPLAAAWDFLGLITDKKCWSKEAIRINSMCVSAVNVATDVILALFPINFLRKVQRPLRERIIIGILMALGLFAAAASSVKLVVGAQFGRTGDLNREGIEIGMWSCVEEITALICACIPCLRSPFQQALEFLGLVTTQAGPSQYAGDYDRYGNSKNNTAGRKKDQWTGKSDGARSGSMSSDVAIKMNAMRSNDEHSEDNILPNGDLKAGQEIWCTTEVYLKQEDKHRSDDLERNMRM